MIPKDVSAGAPLATTLGGHATGDYVKADGEDFSRFYEQNVKRLCTVVRLRTGLKRSHVEDIAQEAFARVLVRWTRLDLSDPPVGYLYKTAFRLSRRRRTAQREVPLGQTEIPGRNEQLALTRIAVETAIRSMPRRQRETALLCLIAGLSPDEAAQVLRIRPPTARVHLHNARKELMRLDLA